MHAKSKSLRQFICEHREELDEAILGRPGMRNYRHKLNDEDRHQWIVNDEGLYNWARSEGVRI